MESTFESQAFSALAIAAVVLLVAVTGGIIYLTAVEWRDRRRRKRDQDSAGRVKPRKSAKSRKSAQGK
ncbi:hypothetical protein C7271_13425 [filamentous cyanobacterium CCP5]|nr:hypothetical protein C7271_13425 [filamentous cyanobacterium CCP5]